MNSYKRKQAYIDKYISTTQKEISSISCGSAIIWLKLTSFTSGKYPKEREQFP
jgi:hypothetical protein